MSNLKSEENISDIISDLKHYLRKSIEKSLSKLSSNQKAGEISPALACLGCPIFLALGLAGSAILAALFPFFLIIYPFKIYSYDRIQRKKTIAEAEEKARQKIESIRKGEAKLGN